MMRKLLLLLLLLVPMYMSAQDIETTTSVEIEEAVVAGTPMERVELIPYGDMERWTTRIIKEAAILGGDTKEVYHLGPQQTLTKVSPWVWESSDSPWGSSSVWACPAGIDKVSVTIFPEEREPGNMCARMEVRKEQCKALGIVNITVVATGSIFLGSMCEPVKSAKNPQSKINQGIEFTGRPKALQLDYKLSLADQIIKATGMRSSEIEGKDNAEISLYLIQRWEDEEGNVYARRVGTGYHKFSESVHAWQNGYRIPIYYGDITGTPYFQDEMALELADGPRYTTNSKGKNVPIQVVGWADADATPTHLMLRISSGDRGAYIGAVGTCFWIDNISLVY